MNNNLDLDNKVLKTDSSVHIPSFENISTQSSDFESVGSLKSPLVNVIKSKNKNPQSSEWKRAALSSDESNNEDDFQSEILRRNTRKQLFRPGTHQILQLKPNENVERKVREKDADTIDLIKRALQNHFVFKNLDKGQIDNLVNQFFFCEVKKDQFIFHQGDDAYIFFILETGRVQVLINEQEKNILTSGQSFGELALLYSAPRSASILTLEDCTLWGIDRYSFRQTIEEMILKDLEENKKFIEKINFFNNMTIAQKENIATILIKEVFSPGEYIVHEGDNADSYYIIKSGIVAVVKDGKVVRELEEGSTFGEAALLEHNNVRAMSVKATTSEVVCLALGRENLIALLGDKVQNIAHRNIVKWAFEKDSLLSKLTQMQKEKVFEQTKSMTGEKNSVILAKGTKCQKIIVPLDGRLIYAESQKVACEKGHSFGADFFLFENFEKKMDEDIILESDCAYSEFSAPEFVRAIGGQLQVILVKNENSHEKRMSVTAIKEDQKLGETKLEDLLYIKNIGRGQFGDVYMVEDLNQKRYALKTVSKTKVLSLCLERHVQEERRILGMVNFPFIMEFYRTFKDNNNVYFLTEYINGVDLFDAIREIGLLGRAESVYYIAVIILAIEYLHTNGIIYRDLKPENVMINHQGFPKLIDMGTCKVLNKSGHRTFTIIGTPTYMAPEVLAGKGYTFSADFWSIGVCLFEFLCGFLPFGENTDDPYEIYSEILSKKLAYPAFMKDKKAKKLLEQLLNRTPEIRNGGSFAALKSHVWFEQFDWDKLMEKELKPPFVPPKNRILSDDEIAEKRKLKRPLLKVMEATSSKSLNKLTTNTSNQTLKNMDWDQEF